MIKNQIIINHPKCKFYFTLIHQETVNFYALKVFHEGYCDNKNHKNILFYDIYESYREAICIFNNYFGTVSKCKKFISFLTINTD